MSMNVGNLVIEMAMNVARLQTDVNKANALVARHTKFVSDSVRQAKSVLGSLGIGLSLAGLVSGIKSSIDFADRLNDLSKVTNLTVEQLSGLDLAARQSGTDLEGAAKAVDKLSANMGKNAKAFADLGINSTNKLAAFKQFADVFNQIADVHQRDAFAAAALGKEWRTVAPLLAEGGKKIEEMIEKGQRLSGITAENVRRADEFNDKLDELTVTFRGLGLSIGNELFPQLIKLNYWFTVIGIGAIEMTEKISLAWELISTPSAWINEKELNDLETRFKNIGRLADEARAQARVESEPGSAGTGGAKPAGKSPDVSKFIDPGADAARKKRLAQQAKYYAESLDLLAEYEQAVYDEEWDAEVTRRVVLMDMKYQQEQEAAAKMKQVWQNFSDSVQRTIGDELYSALNGNFENIGDAFKNMVLRMLVDAEAANLTKSLMGSGIFSIFGIPSFAVGTDYVPHDMLALVHRGEAIVPAAQNAGGAGITLVDNSTINVDSRSDRAAVIADVSRLVDGKQTQMLDRLRREGALV